MNITARQVIQLEIDKKTENVNILRDSIAAAINHINYDENELLSIQREIVALQDALNEK